MTELDTFTDPEEEPEEYEEEKIVFAEETKSNFLTSEIAYT